MNRPRSRLGATSAAYSGAATEATPTPKPSTRRPATSTPDPGASASTIAPTLNSNAATRIVQRRPSRSAMSPAMTAPTRAPSVTQLVMISSRKVLTLNDFWRPSSAPLMTPWS